MTHELTSQCIRNALKENASLQTSIITKLEEISSKMISNRKRATRITQFLHCLDTSCWDGDIKTCDSCSNGIDQTNAIGPSDIGPSRRNASSQRMSRMRRIWSNSDHSRKWNRRFFVDPEKFIPKQNGDVILRRQWEGNMPVYRQDCGVNNNGIYTTGPKSYEINGWSEAEIKKLKRCAVIYSDGYEKSPQSGKEIKLAETNNIDEDSHASDVDTGFTHNSRLRSGREEGVNSHPIPNFQRLTELFHDYSNDASVTADTMELAHKNKSTSNQKSKEQKSIFIPSPFRRTVKQCKTKYLNIINISPFKKQETLKIMQIVRQYKGNPSWKDIARKLRTNRAPFQCFKHYQSNINMDHSDSFEAGLVTLWKPHHDEFLLKFISASGPQFVINTTSVADISRRFLPLFSAQQILVRAHRSLLNPNFLNEKWSDEEDMTLLLCMKIYKNSKSPINRVANHLPLRATKSISEKFRRSLNPHYSSLPYTKEEDGALLNAVATVPGGANNWKEVAKMLPHRNPRGLLHHWIDIADEDILLRTKGEAFLRRIIARQGVVNCLTIRNHACNQENTLFSSPSQNDNQYKMQNYNEYRSGIIDQEVVTPITTIQDVKKLSTDDFVICVKKKDKNK